MGGKVFATTGDPVDTPRMPPAVYHKVKSRCTEILRQHFKHVGSPIDGANKPSFGDIDIVVAGMTEKSRARELALEWSLAQAHPRTGMSISPHHQIIRDDLGAVRVKSIPKASLVHFAVPWPADEEGATGPATDDGHGPKQNYIQVDVNICDSEGQFRWMLFRYGHADFWDLMGTVMRPYGLTVDEKGLNIRIEEMETSNKKKSRVPVTSDPSVVLRLLGLPEEEEGGAGYWERPFATKEDLYEYVAKSPYFNTGCVEPPRTPPGEYRAKKRFVHDYWTRIWIPQCRAEGRFAPPSKSVRTRQSVRRGVLDEFGEAKKEYERRLLEFTQERQRRIIKEDLIKKRFGDDESIDETQRGNVMKALRLIILEDDASYGVFQGKRLKTPDGRLFDMDAVRDFIEAEHNGLVEVVTKKAVDNYKGWLKKHDMFDETKEKKAEIEEGAKKGTENGD